MISLLNKNTLCYKNDKFANKTYDFIKIINLLNKTHEFIKIINLLSKADDFVKNDKFA